MRRILVVSTNPDTSRALCGELLTKTNDIRVIVACTEQQQQQQQQQQCTLLESILDQVGDTYWSRLESIVMDPTCPASMSLASHELALHKDPLLSVITDIQQQQHYQQQEDSNNYVAMQRIDRVVLPLLEQQHHRQLQQHSNQKPEPRLIHVVSSPTLPMTLPTQSSDLTLEESMIQYESWVRQYYSTNHVDDPIQMQQTLQHVYTMLLTQQQQRRRRQLQEQQLVIPGSSNDGSTTGGVTVLAVEAEMAVQACLDPSIRIPEQRRQRPSLSYNYPYLDRHGVFRPLLSHTNSGPDTGKMMRYLQAVPWKEKHDVIRKMNANETFSRLPRKVTAWMQQLFS